MTKRWLLEHTTWSKKQSMHSRDNIANSRVRFVPATGVSFLLPLYDRLADFFTKQTQLHRQLLHIADLQADCRVVDIGCGSGTLLHAALQIQPGLFALGIDIDSDILAQARNKLTSHDKVQLTTGDFAEVSHPDTPFDVLFCTMVFHHLLPDQKRAWLRKALAFAAPNARLFLLDYAKPSSILANLKFLPVRLLDGWRRTACNVKGRLPALLTEAGWSHVSEAFLQDTLLGTVRCYTAECI